MCRVNRGSRHCSDGNSERLSCLTLRQSEDVTARDYLALAAGQSLQFRDEYDRVFAGRWCNRLLFTQRVERDEKPSAPAMRAPPPQRYNEKPCVGPVDCARVRPTPAQPSLERVL
jgi:hypothetical protein